MTTAKVKQATAKLYKPYTKIDKTTAKVKQVTAKIE